MRLLYSDLFSIDPNIHTQPDAETRSAILRLTGKDDETSRRYFLTFKTLAGLSNFAAKPGAKQTDEHRAPPPSPTPQQGPPAAVSPQAHVEEPKRRKSEYHYNIQIHLPVTSDISVYNAIFKSLKDNLDL